MPVKFGQRLVRGFVYGLGLGFVLYLAGAVASAVITTLPTNTGAIGFTIGMLSAIGVELSKEMKSNEQK